MAKNFEKLLEELVLLGAYVTSKDSVETALKAVGWEQESIDYKNNHSLSAVIRNKIPQEYSDIFAVIDLLDTISDKETKGLLIIEIGNSLKQIHNTKLHLKQNIGSPLTTLAIALSMMPIFMFFIGPKMAEMAASFNANPGIMGYFSNIPTTTRYVLTVVIIAAVWLLLKITPVGANAVMSLLNISKKFKQALKENKSALFIISLKAILKSGSQVKIDTVLEQMNWNPAILQEEVTETAYSMYEMAKEDPQGALKVIDLFAKYSFDRSSLLMAQAGEFLQGIVQYSIYVMLGVMVMGMFKSFYGMIGNFKM
jgi:hypothetical protein